MTSWYHFMNEEQRRFVDKKEDVDQRFYDDLEVEDTLGLVVKAHIHLEEEINNLLNLFLPCPKALADM